MKTVIASLLLVVTLITSPVFARNASRNSAHDQGNAVSQGGEYLGSDPDPQVRFDLQRESGSRNGGY
jgi:hypothetical protein